MRGILHRISLQQFLTAGPYEDDDGFKELLTTVARHGLWLAGLLGMSAILLYTASHILIVGKSIVWSYSDINPGSEMALWDKGLIFILSCACVLYSRTSVSLRRSRMLVSLFAWCIAMAILVDDIVVGDLSAGPAYISIALILAAGTIPFKGWHTAVLNAAVIVSAIVLVRGMPALMGTQPLRFLDAQVIYLILLALVLTGLSSQLYLNRYRQYKARRKAEELSMELEEQARTLRLMKEKSDRQAELLLEHERRKDRFFTNISHEFRTPLTLILGPLKDILSEGPEPVTGKKAVSVNILESMRKSGQQLLGMVNQLLDLSKIDAGQIRLNPEPTDLAALAEEIVLSLSPMAERNRVRVHLEKPGGEIPAAVDPEKIRIVLSNLLSNAIKFSPENGDVRVTLKRPGSPPADIEITVSDTGPGISEEDLPYIFDRFYQAESTVKGGSGIGLALVKEIVEMHGGTVRVRSEPGSGTAFTVRLKQEAPRDPAEEHFFTGERSVGNDFSLELEEPTITEDSPTVVVVDDNRDILAYLHSFLSRRYRTLLFENSETALDAIRKQKISLVITDVMMPEPDGFELCRIIKNDPALHHIPVILLTARAGDEHKLEGLVQGADDYINKPFSASELMVRAENLIELRQKLRQKFSEEIHVRGKEIDVSSEDARFLKKVQEAIERHLDNSSFGVDWLADELHLSSRQLQRKIRAITDLSAGGYIRMLRLERARQLLKQKWGNVSEISYEVGFRDTKYFSKLFKQTYGKTPIEITESRGNAN